MSTLYEWNVHITEVHNVYLKRPITWTGLL